MTSTQLTSEDNRTALVTGASRGIGRELAKLFAQDGYDIVLVARSQDQLQQFGRELEATHNIRTVVISKDLSVPGVAEELYEEVTEQGIEVDTLVNNAGSGLYGSFIETDMERVRDLIHLNLLTVTELTKLFAKPMREREAGRILNISSLAAVYPSPKAAVYAATKSYVFSLSVALANELAEDGITVTVLCPKPTDTAGLERGGVQQSALPEGDLLDPESVAQSGYNGLQQGKTIVVPGGVKEKVLHNLPRMLPKTRVAAFARDVWEKR